MKMLTIPAVAELLGFEPSTIREWCRRGKIDARRIGGVWRIPESEANRLTMPNNSPSSIRLKK